MEYAIASPPQVRDETSGLITYRNEKYGFEVRYPQGWALTSSNINNPSNQGQSFIIQSETSKKDFITIGITNTYPYLPDFNSTAPFSKYSIGDLRTQEQVFPSGYCDVSSCSDPFIGIWAKNDDTIYAFTFNNTTEITGVYNQIRSTFKFISLENQPRISNVE